MYFAEHADIAVGKSLAILRFWREFQVNSETVISFMCCLCARRRPLYDVHVNKIERIPRKFRVAGTGVDGHACSSSIRRYIYRCAVIRLWRRRVNSWVLFIFDLLAGRVNLPGLLSLVNVNTPRYHTRECQFFRVVFHIPNYGIHEPLNNAAQEFYEESRPFLHWLLGYSFQNMAWVATFLFHRFIFAFFM
jgi:hypothetical protein